MKKRELKFSFYETEKIYKAANSAPGLSMKPKIKYLLQKLYKMFLHIQYFSSHESTVSLMKPILMRMESHLQSYTKRLAKGRTKKQRREQDKKLLLFTIGDKIMTGMEYLFQKKNEKTYYKQIEAFLNKHHKKKGKTGKISTEEFDSNLDIMVLKIEKNKAKKAMKRRILPAK